MATSSMSASATLGLTAADAVWIATAALHQRYPEQEGFTSAQIQDEVQSENLTSALTKTVYQHIVQHVTATQPANPNKRRMLTETGNGLRRLFLEGDDFHPSRNGAQFTPKPDDLPPQLRHWLDWYAEWSRNHPSNRKPTPAQDLMSELEGTWIFGDADTYLRELRESWE